MIVGEPRVERVEGELKVVDEDGSELVCRRPGSPNRRSEQVIHRVDPSVIKQGTIRPPCGCNHRDEIDWEIHRRADLESFWVECNLCSSPQSKHNGGSPLASKLREMSVEEFDQQTEVRG